MSNNKQTKGVYSKPKVKKPVEKIEEQVESNLIDPEIAEAHPIDLEVFETKLFVEEEPEEINIEPHVEGEKIAEVLEKYHNIDAQAEIETLLEEEPEEEVELVKDDKLTKQLEELQSKIEKFQTIQVVPASPEPTGLEYSEDYHLDLNAEKTLVDKSFEEPESMYTLTEEQEEEGAQAVADVVNNQIIEELKALGYEPKESVTEKIEEKHLLIEKQAKDEGEYFLTEKQAEEVKPLSLLDGLSQHDLRHFHRTGQMPK